MSLIDSNDAQALFTALRYHADTVALVRFTADDVKAVTDSDPEDISWGLVEGDMTTRGYESIRDLAGS